MPAKTPASPEFQALILCGPGVSFNTFTSTPEDFPKALIPIANRPMIWYPLDWCHRANITSITLITPPSSSKAIEDALSRNPHLTSLPLPKADILAPQSLSQNTGTAEILRLPEVQSIITGHFLILPCDLITDLPGSSLLGTWMTYCAPLIGTPTAPGGLGVWYPTKGENAVKGEETNFLITAQLPSSTVPPPSSSLRHNLSQVVYSTTTDTLNDITDSKKFFPIRHGLLRKHGKIRILTTTRDAHIYIFPNWILEFINQNPSFDSLSEDIVGWWAKATWQDGLLPKLGLDHILAPSSTPNDTEPDNAPTTRIENDFDLSSYSTTHVSNLLTPPITPPNHSHSKNSPSSISPNQRKQSYPPVPPFLSYLHPPSPTITTTPLLHRVDTAPLLLSLSLSLASLPTTSPSPLAHNPKIHSTATIAARTTISEDSLISSNTTISQFASIKSSVIGSNCVIASGAKITRCVVMDDVTIGEKSALTGVVVGWRAKVGNGCKLGEGCEVAPGFVVEDGTEGGVGEVFRGFEGLEGDDDDAQMEGEGDTREMEEGNIENDADG
ncbi:MAG: hypothetical protein Q9166_004786 [cf. Caloplaca sp. 2 TL-2023]